MPKKAPVDTATTVQATVRAAYHIGLDSGALTHDEVLALIWEAIDQIELRALIEDHKTLN